jgi:hypothetical protein
MNIPVDCIYEWISGLFPDNLIYRFYPYGSKDLKSLTLLDDRWHDEVIKDVYNFVKRIMIICHDQEPLDFESYQLSTKEIQQNISAQAKSQGYTDKFISILTETKRCEHRIQYNLASCLTSNVNEKFILLHSEQRSSQLEKYGKIAVPAYWWSHAMLARDWYRFALFDPRLCTSSSFAFDFNIYARAWTNTREYRLHFLTKLLQTLTLQDCRITFARIENQLGFNEYSFKNQCFEKHPFLNDIPETHITSDASASYDYHHYNRCAIDVVLETLFDDQRLHLTEKTLRPIACGKPFILVSTVGSLQYLRGYGFETYGDLINEEYDLISDPVARIAEIIREMKRIKDLPGKAKKDFYEKCHQIAKLNQKHFFSEQFFLTLTDELRKNVDRANIHISNIKTKRKIDEIPVSLIMQRDITF